MKTIPPALEKRILLIASHCLKMFPWRKPKSRSFDRNLNLCNNYAIHETKIWSKTSVTLAAYRLIRDTYACTEWRFTNIPKMRDWISSENNFSFVNINILINPSSPSGECPLVCFQNFKSWVHIITFLVIAFPVKKN